MLETIAVVLLLLWLLGVLVLPVAGNLIHALIVVALVLIVIRLMRGRPL